MSKKRLVLFSIAIFVVLSCHEKSLDVVEPQDQYNNLIGLSFIHNQTPFAQESIKTISLKLEEQGYEVELKISNHDPDQQYQQIEELTNEGVNGLVCYPKDARTVLPMIRLANEHGIPIIIYSRPPAVSSHQSVAVVSNDYELGQQLAAHLIEGITKDIHCVILSERFDDLSAINRRDGIIAALKENMKENTTQFEYEWLLSNPFVEDTTSTLEEYLNTNQDVNMLIGTSSAFNSIIKTVIAEKKDQITSGTFSTEGLINDEVNVFDAIASQNVDALSEQVLNVMRNYSDYHDDKNVIVVEGKVVIRK